MECAIIKSEQYLINKQDQIEDILREEGGELGEPHEHSGALDMIVDTSERGIRRIAALGVTVLTGGPEDNNLRPLSEFKDVKARSIRRRRSVSEGRQGSVEDTLEDQAAGVGNAIQERREQVSDSFGDVGDALRDFGDLGGANGDKASRLF